MKTAIKCVKKGKCFPNRLGKTLLGALAGELMEGLLVGKAKAVFSLLRGQRKKGYGERKGQDLSTELQSQHLLTALRDFQEHVKTLLCPWLHSGADFWLGQGRGRPVWPG